jgi:hypothetical protein
MNDCMTAWMNESITCKKQMSIELKKLFEMTGLSYNDLSAKRILNELNDNRKELTEDVIWTIIVESFIEVSGAKDEARNVNYLLAKIRGKKKDLHSAIVLQNSSKKLNHACRQARVKSKNYDKESNKGLELAKAEFEKNRSELTDKAINKIKRLLAEKKHLSVFAELCKTDNRLIRLL